MCATSTSLAQGRESPGEGPNRGKIGLTGGQNQGRPRPSLIRFPIFSQRGLLGPRGAGIAGPAGAAQYVQQMRFTGGALSQQPDHTVMTDEKPAIRQHHTLRGDEARQDRLKAKLRENLKRRKSQVKERSRLEVSPDGHQASRDGEVGKSGA